jgi:RNA polymerase sigma-70 factor, ECF subfamily
MVMVRFVGRGGARVHAEGLADALANDLAGTFEQLVQTYQDRLYSFGLHLSGRPWDAEEIAQDTFVRAYRALERYPTERIRTLRLKPWLLQIALNVFRNRVRGKVVEMVPYEPTPDGAIDEPAAPDGELPEQMAQRAEERELLHQLLLRLPERQRVAVVLRHVQGMTYDDIGVLLGQPVGTVKANVHRGVRLLRASLEESPGAAELAPGGGTRA